LSAKPRPREISAHCFHHNKGLHAHFIDDTYHDVTWFLDPPYWGKVVEHERGWRAQFAYPKALFLAADKIPFSLSEINSRLKTLTEFGTNVFLLRDCERVKLWIHGSGFEAAGLDYLVKTRKEYYVRRQQDRTLKKGDRCWVSCSNVLSGSAVSRVPSKINDFQCFQHLFGFNSVPGHHKVNFFNTAEACGPYRGMLRPPSQSHGNSPPLLATVPSGPH
jgi:hypothetical protein